MYASVYHPSAKSKREVSPHSGGPTLSAGEPQLLRPIFTTLIIRMESVNRGAVKYCSSMVSASFGQPRTPPVRFSIRTVQYFKVTLPLQRGTRNPDTHCVTITSKCALPTGVFIRHTCYDVIPQPEHSAPRLPRLCTISPPSLLIVRRTKT